MSLFEQFAPLRAISGLRHTLSTREGGVSVGPYATLNLGYHVGDDPARVTENRRRLAIESGYPAGRLTIGQQVHGTRLAWVTTAERGRGAFSWDDALPDTDGLLTAESETPIGVLVADCAPVLLVDPTRRVLAVAHAGWRGALGRIASAAIREMIGAGSAPGDCLVAIGPTLCPDCLEVGEEVVAQVMPVFPTCIHTQAGARPHLDIRRLIAEDLHAAGVPPTRIIRHPVCPRCHPERFYSHRAQGGVAGRFALVAWWE